MQRCELTDLLPDQCGCKNHRNCSPTVETSDIQVGAAFVAKYRGCCVVCREWYDEGERIAVALVDGQKIGYVCSCRTGVAVS